MFHRNRLAYKSRPHGSQNSIECCKIVHDEPVSVEKVKRLKSAKDLAENKQKETK